MQPCYPGIMEKEVDRMKIALASAPVLDRDIARNKAAMVQAIGDVTFWQDDLLIVIENISYKTDTFSRKTGLSTATDLLYNIYNIIQIDREDWNYEQAALQIQ